MIYGKYLLLSKYHKYINIKYDLQLPRYMATVTFYNVNHHCSKAPLFNRWIDFKIFIKTSHAGFREKNITSCYSMFIKIHQFKRSLYIYILLIFESHGVMTYY